jgi:NCAIR mutase (PurE)-related protein
MELGLSNQAIEGLESSFEDYKIATEARILAVEKELKTWKTVGIVTVVFVVMKTVFELIPK